MPETFTESMHRTDNTAAIMDARKIDDRKIQTYGAIGVISGFRIGVATPNSTKIVVSRGIVLSPLGKEVLRTVDPNLAASAYQSALRADTTLFDIQANIGATAYAAVDPAAKQFAIVFDSIKEVLNALVVTNAEETAWAGQISGGGVATGFVASTADHRARAISSLQDPDDRISAAVNEATEFIIGFAVKSASGAGGVINSVVQSREKASWESFSGL